MLIAKDIILPGYALCKDMEFLPLLLSHYRIDMTGTHDMKTIVGLYVYSNPCHPELNFLDQLGNY